MLQIRDLKLSGVEKLKNLSPIHLTLQRGEVVALIGPNGVGKTSLLKSVAGLTPVERGEIRIDQQVLTQKTDLLSWSEEVFYVGPYLFSEFSITVEETLSLLRRSDAKKIRTTLEELGASSLIHQELNSLSGGEIQKILLARAWLQGAGHVLLDETLSLMDLHHQAFFGKMLKEKAQRDQMGFLWVSHDVNLASEWADRCYFMSKEGLFGGGLVENEFTSENFRRLYPNAEIEVVKSVISKKPKLFLR